MIRRTIGAVALAALLATALTGCIGTDDRDLAGWLNGRDGVESTTAQAEYPELIYHGYVDAELDAKASNKTIQTLIRDTLDYIASHDITDVDVDFGVKGLTFAVSDDSLDVLPLWQKVRTVPDVASGWVTRDEIHVRTVRTHAFDILAATADFHADLSVDTYASEAELPTPQQFSDGTYVDPLSIHRAASCAPDPVIAQLVSDIAQGDVVEGSLDLCDGIQVQFTKGYAIGAEAVSVRETLDAADLSDFPVTLDALATGAAAPSDDPGYDPADAPEHHRVEVSPGDPTALGVLAALDAASAPVLYDLRNDQVAETADATTDADTAEAAEAAGDPLVRTLLVSSRALSATDLAALIAGAPAASAQSLASIRIDDGTVGAIGTSAQLSGLTAAATALQAADDEIEFVSVAGPNAEIGILSTGHSDEVPDVDAVAHAVQASGLWQGRDLVILYDNQRADVIDGVSQTLDPSHFNNDDEVLQGFLDAWTALPRG